MKPLRLFAGLSGYRNGNAGDQFSAPLVARILGREVQVVAEPEGAELFAAGSILHRLPDLAPAGFLGKRPYSGAVWGAGCIEETERIFAPMADVLALRGPLTARRFRSPLPPDVPFGDPGLLVSRYWAAEPKRWKLGIVPHYVDAQDDRVTQFARRWPDDVTVIDICTNVADVLRSISECEAILSSSLHGLVFADSYGVPNAWIELSDKIVGRSFKFRDYYAATIREHDPMPVQFDGSETVTTMARRIGDSYRPAPVKAIGDRLVDALVRWSAKSEPEPPDEAEP